ncbi:acyl carrier protein [Tremella mesenterica]|uniref:Acyl carrier protein n=2 Tax=Tremella mesenterica TaxID=5217 RepID=A0A4Q1BQ42_TREME|nr:acyl carrier protein [Tremella mesenterica]
MNRSFILLRPILSRSIIPPSTSISLRIKPTLVPKWRGYSAAAGLKRSDIEERVIDVMKSFEKVETDKLTPTATFTSDLGLDSLDSVEVVMAIEEEFGIEIPDDEADKITTVGEAIEYVVKTPEGKSSG